jgi:hypothetical protein
MKVLCALVFVCMSFHAFAIPAETLDNPTAAHYPGYFNDLDDLDVVDEIAAQSMGQVPGLATTAVEPDTRIADDETAAQSMGQVPGIAAAPAVEPDTRIVDDETAAQSISRVQDIAAAPAVEPDTRTVEKDGVENSNAVDTVPGIAAIRLSDED